MASIVFYKPISKNLYFTRYIENEQVMAFYEALLKKVNTNLSLNTSIKELPPIFSILEKWDSILNDRLKNAPSKVLAKELFNKELLETIEHYENAIDTTNDNNYWNKFRKVAYDFYIKGQNVTLKYLGYLILKNVVENVDGIDISQNISSMYDVEGAILSLAEGAALAEYLHGKKDVENSSRTKQLIENEFGNTKETCFTSNSDFEFFVTLLANFFEAKEYKIPSTSISLVRGSKTKIAAIFNPLHKKLAMSEKSLKSDTDYFNIIKVLSHFSSKSNDEIYKDITR